MRNKRSALFLDRDGTLMEDVGFIDDPARISVFPGVIEALRELQKRYLLFVVTNQSGVAKGLLTTEQVTRVNKALDDLFAGEGIEILEWYVCPHDKNDGCECIKPRPMFLLEAADKYAVDLSRSFVLGDHPHDPATAEAVGAFGIYLLTGHGSRHAGELPDGTLMFHSFEEAADWILKHPDPSENIKGEIEKGAEIIRRGGLVAFPTETVYGLGADVFNPTAVARIFEVKKRPLHDPLIAHIADPDDIGLLAETPCAEAAALIKKFWPGPLTLVLPKKADVPDIVTAGNNTVAVRMPSNRIALDLIRKAGKPIAAPSANMFGMASPTTVRHVRDQLGAGCDLLIDGGACRVGVESTVVSFAGGNPVVLRPGGITVEDIESVAGPVVDGAADAGDGMESPGMTPSHYAPVTRLLVVDDMSPFAGRSDVGKLFFRPPTESFAGPAMVLSETGSLAEAAVNLYYSVRHLDSLGLDLIVAEQVPSGGLGRAVRDRLKKASKKQEVL